MDNNIYDIIIIGAGVIGCFLARELSKYDIKVLVLEKNNDVGNEVSSANSAIVHSGYDPNPNSLKAKLNVLGNQMYDKICQELDVEFERIGSLTLALSVKDIDKLEELRIRALENNVECQIILRDKLKEIEPNISDLVQAGLYAKTAGIINPFSLCVNLMENAIDNKVILKLNTKVDKIIKDGDIFIINNEYRSRVVINCAGLYSAYINELVNPKTFEIIPRKGEYLVLNHFDNDFVKHTLFLLPSDKGKGVLISPTTSNNYLIGPSAEVCDIDDNATDGETHNQIKKTASKMIANIPFDKTIRVFAGIRPTPNTHDFIIEESKTKNFINVAGIESPGIASAPAIAKMVIEDILKLSDMDLKTDFYTNIRKHSIIKGLPFAEKEAIIQQNKDYGEIVCKCEQVSKGEILDALKRSCPPTTIKGLKKRLRVGFGLCQGGMCQSYALKILADYYHVDMKDIMYDDSYILLTKTKGEL